MVDWPWGMVPENGYSWMYGEEDTHFPLCTQMVLSSPMWSRKALRPKNKPHTKLGLIKPFFKLFLTRVLVGANKKKPV